MCYDDVDDDYDYLVYCVIIIVEETIVCMRGRIEVVVSCLLCNVIIIVVLNDISTPESD